MELESHNLKPLDRISPSSAVSLELCPFKVVLAKTFKRPVLPYGPASYLGNIIHECLKDIMSGGIKSAEDFEFKWSENLEKQERKLKELGFEFYIPLSENTSEFTIKKLLTKSLVKRTVKRTPENYRATPRKRVLSEKWLESKDSKIAGQADLIVFLDDSVKLSDFKSGKILEEEGEVKEDYTVQIRLYAYLFNENFDRYPNKLTIVDLDKAEYEIEFRPEQCEELASKYKRMLRDINRLIVNKEFSSLAKPDLKNCGKCLYRPACKYYWSLPTTESDSLFTDIKGRIIDIRQFRNGNINVKLHLGSKQVVVTHVDTDNLTLLESIKGAEAAFYNVLRVGDKDNYKAIKTTKIFKTNA